METKAAQSPTTLSGVQPPPHTVPRWLRRFNKQISNRLMRLFAGRRGFYSALLTHVGRHSGKVYTTPVVAEPVSQGFVIPLAYGADTDWCLNLRAASSSTIKRHGVTYLVHSPQVIDAAEALPLLPPARQRQLRRLGIATFLRVQSADAPVDSL